MKQFWLKNKKECINLIIFTIVSLIIFRGILSIGYIPSASMEPTLKVGDITITNRLAYIVKEPGRGEIITFKREGKVLIKRVIGVEGDTITFDNGEVYINGIKLDESEYIDADVKTICRKEFVVPNDCVFVLGDNRENSYDSRYWEEPFVAEEEIISKHMYTISIK